MQRTQALLTIVLSTFILLVTSAPQYQLENVKRLSNGFTGLLALQSGVGPYGDDIPKLKFELYFETKSRVHLRIGDSSAKRWQVPNIAVSQTPTMSPKV